MSHWHQRVAILIVGLLLMLVEACAVAGPSCHFDGIMIREIRDALNQKAASTSVPNDVARTSIELGAGRRANGYWIHAGNSAGPQGYFLALPGNAQSALELVVDLRPVAAAGFDVFAYDYIDLFGNAPLPRLANLASDAVALVDAYAKDSHYQRKANVLYGVSTGGLLLIQAVKGRIPQQTKVILDSIPDEIPFFLFCESGLNPGEAAQTLSFQAGSILVLNGKKDEKVFPSNSRRTAEAVERNGGCYEVLPNGAHPFEARDDVGERLTAIIDFSTRGCPR